MEEFRHSAVLPNLSGTYSIVPVSTENFFVRHADTVDCNGVLTGFSNIHVPTAADVHFQVKVGLDHFHLEFPP